MGSERKGKVISEEGNYLSVHIFLTSKAKAFGKDGTLAIFGGTFYLLFLNVFEDIHLYCIVPQ